MQNKKFIVLDGGTGREIKKRGLPFRQPEWSALVLKQKPEALIDIHSDFIEAGAQIITTNTYALVPYHITEQVFFREGPQLIRLACDMAISAKRKYPQKNVQIAFSIPPMFGSYRYDFFVENKQKAEAYYQFFLDSIKDHEQDLDIFLCETLSGVDEAGILCRLLQKKNKPYAISFSLDNETQDLRGGTMEQLRELLNSLQKKPTHVMLNCCKPEVILNALPTLKKVLPQGIQMGCYPNNFANIINNEIANEKLYQFRTDMTFQSYVEESTKWIQCGATAIGGCCGIGPEYMPAIIQAIKKYQIKQK